MSLTVKTKRKEVRDPVNARFEFYKNVSQGRLSLADTVREMRRIAGKTQTEYARLVGVAPRIVIDLERGVGNPTLKSLERIGAPFGLKLVFRSKSPLKTLKPDLGDS